MAANTDLENIRKSQIITAAIGKIAEAGISNVTMDDIAEASGLSKGGIAHYFASKEALYNAAFREFFERIFVRSRDTMGMQKDPLAKLLSFDWLYDENDVDVNMGYRLHFDSMSMATRDETHRRLFHEWVNNWIELLGGAIIEGQAQGKFRDLDPEATARTISAIYHGIAVRWYLDRESHSRDWAVKSFVESITRLLSV